MIEGAVVAQNGWLYLHRTVIKIGYRAATETSQQHRGGRARSHLRILVRLYVWSCRHVSLNRVL
jgi:hypothetical protein